MSLRALIRLIVLALVLAGAWCATVCWVAPPLLENWLERSLPPALGVADLRVADLRLSPLTLRLELGPVSGRDEAGRELFSLERLTVRPGLASLSRRRLVLSSLSLSGLRSHFPPPSRRPRERAESAPAEARPAALPIHVERLTVRDGTLLIGPPGAVQLTLEGVDLSLVPLVLTADRKLAPAELEGGFRLAGQPVLLRGSLSDAGARLTVSATDLPLSALPPDWGRRLRLDALGGAVTAALELGWDGVAVSVQGRLSGRDLRLARGDREAELRVAEAEAEIAALDPRARRLSLSRLALRRPFLSLGRETAPGADRDGAGGGGGPAPARLAWRGTGWSWAIERTEISDGSLRYIRPGGPDQALEARDITAQLSGLSDAGPPATLSAEGAVGPGRIQLSGELRPRPLRAELSVDATDLDLPSLAPWLGLRPPLAALAGQLNLNGRLLLTDAPDLGSWRGDARISLPRAAADGRRPALAWERLELSGIAAAPLRPLTMTVSEARLSQPRPGVARRLSELADLFGSLAEAGGHHRAAQRARRLAADPSRELILRDLRYRDGHWSAGGAGGAAWEALSGLLGGE